MSREPPFAIEDQIRREADEWLQRAQRDLLIAERVLLSRSHPHRITADTASSSRLTPRSPRSSRLSRAYLSEI